MSKTSEQPHAMMRIAIIGAGGHARVIGDALLASIEAQTLNAEFVGWVDHSAEKGTMILNRLVLGKDSDAAILAKQGDITAFIIGVGGIAADSKLRQKLFNHYQSLGLNAVTIIHPSAIVARDVVIGAGCAVMAGAVINVGSVIGDNTIINTRSSIDHDVIIGHDVHIAPGAVLSGDVHIGPLSHIGTGASIRQGIHIGTGATIGVGAAVVTDIADYVIAAGVPARPR